MEETKDVNGNSQQKPEWPINSEKLGDSSIDQAREMQVKITMRMKKNRQVCWYQETDTLLPRQEAVCQWNNSAEQSGRCQS